jgi:acyl carrier protein phosphodiesterase
MNWLAHIFLSEPNVESRLGNLLGDLVKGKDLDDINPNLRQGMARHYAISQGEGFANDKFTDSHPVVKISKQRIDRNYSKFAGILIDIFYDHFLAKNWELYSYYRLSDFTAEIYASFQNYQGDIPALAKQKISQIIEEDWLTSYQHLSGVENALGRIDDRIKARMGDKIKLVDAMKILEREYTTLETDFNLFFPELQQHIES